MANIYHYCRHRMVQNDTEWGGRVVEELQKMIETPQLQAIMESDLDTLY